MKTKKLSLLFLFFLLFTSYHGQCQSSNDALERYVNLFNQVSSIDSLLVVYKFFETDFEDNSINNNDSRAVYDLFYMANVEYRLGLYYDSEYTAVKALRILDKMPVSTTNKLTRKSFYNHLGRIRKIFKDYKSSLGFYYKALNLCISKKDSALILNNIGNLHRDDQKYVKAKEVLKVSHNLYIQMNVKDHNYTMCLVNLGFVEGMLGMHKKGIAFINEALEIRKKSKSPKIFEAYHSLTDYYIKKKQYSNAVKYAKLGLKAAQKFNSTPYKLLALRNLVELEQPDYLKSYIRLKDSIDLNNQINENKFAQAKYDFARERLAKEKERTKRVESDIRAQKNKTESVLYLTITLFILIISTLIYFVVRARHKKEKLMQVFSVEQRISKQLHDEVANDVFFTMSKVQNNLIEKEQLLDDLESMYTKTRNISKVNSDINVSSNYKELLEDLILSYTNNKINIFINSLNEINWISISEDKKKVLYRVIQELLTNMKKHSQADLVSFNFSKKLNKLVVQYADNGVGRIIKKGNGLTNVENRIKMVKGTITFETEEDQGSHIKIIL